MRQPPLPAQPILSSIDFEEALRHSENGLAIVYKHSPICELSEMARGHVAAFEKQLPPGVKLFYVDVIGSRMASMHIEKTMGILHESPQILYLRDRQCVWSASHRAISRDSLRAQMEKSLP